MNTRPIIVWFQRDLRLGDHAALSAALKTKQPIIPLYIWATHQEAVPPLGAASRWWLQQSLQSLEEDLKALGSQLVKRAGPPADVLRDMIKTTKATGLYFQSSVRPGSPALESELKALGNALGVDVRRFRGELLFAPGEVFSKTGTPYKVFTPFWNACLKAAPPPAPLPPPKAINSPETFPKSEPLASWELYQANPDWAAAFPAQWHPGEKGALTALTSFTKGPMKSYAVERDRPGVNGTSRLSPHLQLGEVSVGTCWHHAKAHPDSAAFLRELGWREFCYHLLAHWPQLDDAPFRPEFKHFPWQPDDHKLKAWQQGQTGYPIIDAGMRQLWQTGWMHNRVRMIVGSFLVKNLLQPWQAGRDWFWDTLVDADLANNSCGWQWVAGCGADAAPYFRIFNPVTQSKKFDPKGAYIRRYIPELKDVPSPDIHDPSSAPKMVLEAAGVELGKTYPRAITDLALSRQAALDALNIMKTKINRKDQ